MSDMSEQKQQTKHEKPTWMKHVPSWRFLLIFMVLCAVLLGIAGTVAWRVAGYASLIQDPVTAALGFGEDWSDDALSESQYRGDAIIAAIKQYQMREGKLPPTLVALIPDDIARIEQPVAGNRQWRYGALGSHEGEYFLLVESEHGNKPGYYGVEWFRYTSLGDKWEVFQDDSFLIDRKRARDPDC